MITPACSLAQPASAMTCRFAEFPFDMVASHHPRTPGLPRAAFLAVPMTAECRRSRTVCRRMVWGRFLLH